MNMITAQAGIHKIEQINEQLDLDLPVDEEFDTLGGLVFSQLTYIPADGSTPELDLPGLHIRVEELSERRVEWALLTKLPPRSEDPEQPSGRSGKQ